MNAENARAVCSDLRLTEFCLEGSISLEKQIQVDVNEMQERLKRMEACVVHAKGLNMRAAAVEQSLETILEELDHLS